MHPDQPGSIPTRKWFGARQGEGLAVGEAGEEGWRGSLVCVVDGSGLPASLPSLFPSFLLGVPLLFVIPWGIVKYLYEDEG